MRALAYHAVQLVLGTRLLLAARVAIRSSCCASRSLAPRTDHIYLHGSTHALHQNGMAMDAAEL